MFDVWPLSDVVSVQPLSVSVLAVVLCYWLWYCVTGCGTGVYWTRRCVTVHHNHHDVPYHTITRVPLHLLLRSTGCPYHCWHELWHQTEAHQAPFDNKDTQENTFINCFDKKLVKTVLSQCLRASGFVIFKITVFSGNQSIFVFLWHFWLDCD